MALSSTVYAASIELSDVDRGVYQTLDLRLAQHPSETAEFLATRLLAYCLEYEEGIAFGDGVSTPDMPAVLVRDLTGRVTKWVEIGMPAAARVHRGHKLAGRAAVYTHRDLRQVLAQLDGQGIFNAADVPVYGFERAFVEAMAAGLARRSTWTMTVMERTLYVEGAHGSLVAPLTASHFS